MKKARRRVRSSRLQSKLTFCNRGMSTGPRPEKIHLDQSIDTAAAPSKQPEEVDRARSDGVLELDELPLEAESIGDSRRERLHAQAFGRVVPGGDEVDTQLACG